MTLDQSEEELRLSSQITGAQLLEIGEIDESPDSFVQEVAALLASNSALEDQLMAESGGLINTVDSPDLHPLKKLQTHLECGTPGQCHYFATSAHHNQPRESLYAAMLSKIATASGYHPLVIPIDAFYQYQGVPTDSDPSIVRKTRYFGEQNPVSQRDGLKHLIILTNVSASPLFDEKILRRVPMEAVALGTDKFRDFVSYKLAPAIKQYGGPVRFLEEMIKKSPGIEDDIRLGICAAMLASNQREWQRLFHSPVPLIIAAPQSFHDALNRISNGSGGWGMEYMYRAATHVDEPIFERGSICDPNKGISDERNFQAYHSGVGTKEFEIAVEALMKLQT